MNHPFLSAFPLMDNSSEKPPSADLFQNPFRLTDLGNAVNLRFFQTF